MWFNQTNAHTDMDRPKPTGQDFPTRQIPRDTIFTVTPALYWYNGFICTNRFKIHIVLYLHLNIIPCIMLKKMIMLWLCLEKKTYKTFLISKTIFVYPFFYTLSLEHFDLIQRVSRLTSGHSFVAAIYSVHICECNEMVTSLKDCPVSCYDIWS